MTAYREREYFHGERGGREGRRTSGTGLNFPLSDRGGLGMSASVRKLADMVEGDSDMASSRGVRTEDTKSRGRSEPASKRLKTFQPLPFLTLLASDSVITRFCSLSLRAADIFSMLNSSSAEIDGDLVGLGFSEFVQRLIFWCLEFSICCQIFRCLEFSGICSPVPVQRGQNQGPGSSVDSGAGV